MRHLRLKHCFISYGCLFSKSEDCPLAKQLSSTNINYFSMNYAVLLIKANGGLILFLNFCVLSSYPDATPEELQQGDNVCIICREEMTTGCKKLPCNHIFHTSCLRSWFQRQQTCPTCRMDVLRPQPPPQPQQPPPPQVPQPPFGFPPMGVPPPPPMGIPPTPGVSPQGLPNGKNLFKKRLVCIINDLMPMFSKTCIFLTLPADLIFFLEVDSICLS